MHRAPTDAPPAVVLTDLDGCLVDPANPRAEAAREALADLRAARWIVCFVTTKTREEVARLQEEIGVHDPAVVEGGGALWFPEGGAVAPAERARLVPGGSQIDRATPRGEILPSLRAALAPFPFARPFADLADDEIVAITGLRPEDVPPARRREFDEPVAIEGATAGRTAAVSRALAEAGLGGLEGGSFLHALRGSDKGRAARELTALLGGPGTRTIGVGDAALDLAFLRDTGLAVIVQRPDGSWSPELTAALPRAMRASPAGSAGWNRAMLALLRAAP